ncbi:MAG: hypothetical protein HOQ28_19630 [Thermoleophilia bacterium]|nr:hypothetical protein [Thermoleophilia bacterium]
MDEEMRLRRLAENELIRKEANEEIERQAREEEREGGIRDPELEFFCACGRPDCDAKLLLTLSEYEAASGPDRFIVVPGHDNPQIEQVVEAHDRYLVVEKQAGFQPDERR